GSCTAYRDREPLPPTAPHTMTRLRRARRTARSLQLARSARSPPTHLHVPGLRRLRRRSGLSQVLDEPADTAPFHGAHSTLSHRSRPTRTNNGSYRRSRNAYTIRGSRTN